MPYGAIAAAVIGAYSANQQSRAGERGANAQVAASREATAEQRRQFDQTREDMAPWLNAGRDALGRQTAILNGDWSGFRNSPDYQYALEEGFKGLDRGAAATGNLYSGGADADRIRLGQGLATQNFNNHWNRLAGMSNTGQVTGGQLGQFGQRLGDNIGNNLMDAAMARSSAYMNTANAWGRFGNNLAGAFNQYAGSRRG